MNRSYLVLIAAAGMLAGGCANVASPRHTVATDAPNLGVENTPIVRTGSNIPVRDRYMGPELLRMTDAKRDPQAVRNLVDPMQGLKDPMSGQ